MRSRVEMSGACEFVPSPSRSACGAADCLVEDPCSACSPSLPPCPRGDLLRMRRVVRTFLVGTVLAERTGQTRRGFADAIQ